MASCQELHVPVRLGLPPLVFLPKNSGVSLPYNVSGPLYNRTINKEGDTMDNEYIQELFDQAASGEISYLELQDYLDDARFDGDIIDFL